MARVAAALTLCTLAACHGLVAGKREPAAPVPATGGGNFVLDSAHSRIIALVYRDGPLAALGHNHVIVFGGLRGQLDWHGDVARIRYHVDVPVSAVDIDDAARRAELGPDFSTVVDDNARAGTRRNMLGERLLDAAHYPEVSIDALRVGGEGGSYTVRSRVRVHGRDSEVELPVQLETLPDGSLHLAGATPLDQSALGLTPFSVLMGALRVADGMKVSIDLRFTPAPAGSRN